MSTTQADDALGAALVGGFQVFDEFEPLVATDQRVNLVQTQDCYFDSGGGEPVEVKGGRGGAWGSQSVDGESIDAGSG